MSRTRKIAIVALLVVCVGFGHGVAYRAFINVTGREKIEGTTVSASTIEVKQAMVRTHYNLMTKKSSRYVAAGTTTYKVTVTVQGEAHTISLSKSEHEALKVGETVNVAYTHSTVMKKLIIKRIIPQ